MNSNSKRNQLLEAAAAVIRTQGVEKLTLEAVAREAGVSKGGLLHHFPNKAALVSGMFGKLCHDFSAEVETKASHDPAAGNWSRAYLEATGEDLQGDKWIGTALSAALFSDPELLKDIQADYSHWQRQIEQDSNDPVLSTVIRLAADGLWFAEMFGLGRLDPGLRDQVLQRLLEMSRQEEGGSRP
ncbi:TetR/AcrR family transcriptional regulator [Paenibacillus tengchongensis]|uniref:TetR/AcrR family transcriptional regulator n=1 Tax=Paenibacillus tengchongensis TaxID=2608684 RepID=UPI00124C81DF|nr:TetR/AcrR family transcriptional regulator [Paenibacillus tengchongensis]